jgi:hypothetical protein
MLRDKFLENLEEAKEWATKIEENMLASKVELVHQRFIVCYGNNIGDRCPMSPQHLSFHV